MVKDGAVQKFLVILMFSCSQVPEEYVTKEIFDAVSVYIIPKPQLQRTILTVSRHRSKIQQRVFLHVGPDNECENQLTEWALNDSPVGDLEDVLDTTLTGRKSSFVWPVMSNIVIPGCGFGGNWLMSRRRRRCVKTRVGRCRKKVGESVPATLVLVEQKDAPAT
uniref:Uncharacterized protein n=1 Tax=Timema tahoe TaxID=61484 RepID=A0A7R9IGV7_9NEOP|nr:unnamed protein product [Timema tahoe]